MSVGRLFPGTILLIRYEVTPVKDWEKEFSPRLTLLRQPNEKRNDSATIDQSDMRGLGTA